MALEKATQTTITDDRLQGIGICVKNESFACLVGPTVNCDGRQRVVIPDQLGVTEVHALADMFTAAAKMMRNNLPL